MVVRADASYLITGGLGALGLEVAQQLVADGARRLLLVGRRGVRTASQQQRLAELTATGAMVEVVEADIAESTSVAHLLAHCPPEAPLRGIVHAAGLLFAHLYQTRQGQVGVVPLLVSQSQRAPVVVQ